MAIRRQAETRVTVLGGAGGGRKEPPEGARLEGDFWPSTGREHIPDVWRPQAWVYLSGRLGDSHRAQHRPRLSLSALMGQGDGGGHTLRGRSLP